MYKKAIFWALTLVVLFLVSCGDTWSDREVNGSLQPSFSQDTLRVDTLYSRFSSSTKRLVVYNRHKAPILFERITLEQDPLNQFRINVDGRSGRNFQQIPLFPLDSMFVFVEATFPEGSDDFPTRCEATLSFSTAGHTSQVLLEGFRLNTDHVDALLVHNDKTIGGTRPLFVRDSIYVAEGSTLRLLPNTHLLMGDEAKIVVAGTLIAEGTPQEPILIEGVRRDELVTDVNYRLIPGQWEEIRFLPSSSGNKLRYTTIRNGRGGVAISHPSKSGAVDLTLYGCHIANMKGNAIRAEGATIHAVNCLFANTLASTLAIRGGEMSLFYCTVANFYPFDRRQGVAIALEKTEDGAMPTMALSHSVVEGSYSIQRTAGSPPQGGEIAFDKEHPEWVSLERSYLKSPLAWYTSSLESIEATLPADSLFRSLGKDHKADKYTFEYDFRPLETAPFAKKGGISSRFGAPPERDLLGVERLEATSWGAYEAVPVKEEETSPQKQ